MTEERRAASERSVRGPVASSRTISTAVMAASRPLLDASGRGAAEGLVDGLGGEHPEDDRHAGVQLDRGHARRALAGHES